MSPPCQQAVTVTCAHPLAIFLDGLDECQTEDAQLGTMKLVNEFVRLYPIRGSGYELIWQYFTVESSAERDFRLNTDLNIKSSILVRVHPQNRPTQKPNESINQPSTGTTADSSSVPPFSQPLHPPPQHQHHSAHQPQAIHSQSHSLRSSQH